MESSRGTVREAGPSSESAVSLCSSGLVASTNCTMATSSCIKAPKKILVVICVVICGSSGRIVEIMIAEENEEKSCPSDKSF